MNEIYKIKKAKKTTLFGAGFSCDLMERYEYFRVFHDTSTQTYNLLALRLKTRALKKGNLITVPGQVQKEIYFVNSGVQMSRFDASDKTHVIAFPYPANLCAIPESFSFQAPSKYFLTCLTGSGQDYIAFEELQKLFDQSQQLERLFRRVTEFVLAKMINPHIELHSLSIGQRFQQTVQ